MHHRTAPFPSNLYPASELGYYECGRDLFTFVTVASTHIMRTLQKPKKCKPTKRKVNHRRFLQNQIYRKYSVIEAATQQLATSIFSQEVVVGKQSPTPKHLNYADKSIPLEDLREEKIPPLQDVINLPSNLPALPDGRLSSSTFLGVAEAYLVPDTMSKIGISMDTLAGVSDEVDTVESLFDDIITENDIFASPYGLLHPKVHQLHKTTRMKCDSEPTQQTGLIFGDTNRPSWLLESFDKSGHHLPLFWMTPNSVENERRDPEMALHDMIPPDDVYTPKGTPKMSLTDKGHTQIQTDYECDHDIDSAGQSVGHLTKATLRDDTFIGKDQELLSTRTDDSIDYNVCWASAKEPNTINVYRTLCLNHEEHDNFLCSSW